jgi:flagellum-specific ATP synthase
MDDLINFSKKLHSVKNKVLEVSFSKAFGSIKSIKGILIEIVGLSTNVSIGSRCVILNQDKKIVVEIIGFNNDIFYAMSFSDVFGIKIGDKVIEEEFKDYINPSRAWLGRVINALGEPIDDKGPLINGNKKCFLKAHPPNPQKRNRVKDRIDLGVRSIDTFISCCYGQRMGIFAGSGVGKSVLISMMARYAKTDIKIIGLVGERGREVQEFICDYMNSNLENVIIIVATSDESALIRRQAAYLTVTLAEYFRDEGLEVLCIIDSITRFAQAQREIGLSLGEPPTSKGYTPTTFTEMPKLLERAGPGTEETGNITGLFTILVEGDDTNEPISDAVRGILDGHIILDRAIAERGRYPAVDILKSVSRTMPKCNTEKQTRLIVYAKKILSTYQDMSEMIKIGAYKKGSNQEVDMAMQFYPQIESFLNQDPSDATNMEKSYEILSEILNSNLY